MNTTAHHKRILITNGQVVNEGRIFDADIYVKEGRIDAVGPDLSNRPADVTLDASGCHIFPGMIDDQVHFREPGLTHKGDIRSESLAAAAGGITSFMEMPNTNPPTTTLARLEEKYALAKAASAINYAFYLGGANDNLEEIKRLDPKQACGVKVFMGASTGNMLVDDPAVLEKIFAHAPTLVATHCEDTPTIDANAEKLKEKYGTAIPVTEHPNIRSAEACLKSTELAIELASKHNTRLHVLHLSTADELALFTKGDLTSKQITAECCVHHLHFCDEDYLTLGSRIKCNPAIKSAQDRQAIIMAVVDDRVDVIATDHAPHLLSEKNGTDYFKVPAGLPLVQYALPSLLERYHQGVFTLPLIVEKTAHAPARLFDVKERGFIREGFWADLAILRLNDPFEATDSDVISKCGWTPFAGQTFQSQVVTTLVSGQVAFHQGQVDPTVRGMRLTFDR